ncbi:SDR family oxidoreductase [Yinghuangia sp. YIM S10712]|uniref:SDR family oxidoreductase n=1 Tax=Yinghuangia sp. YIM S10712 TaxID=3436930 RepID=UPI003F53924B
MSASIAGPLTARLSGKVALVTGGSRGIGRAVAERLGRDGAIVAVNYARNAAAAQEVVEAIRSGGGTAFPVHAELGPAKDGGAGELWAAFDAGLAAHAPQAGPGLDILVNNAAVATSSSLYDLTPDEFDTVFGVNVKAPFFIVKEGLTRLRDGGRIVNISSGVVRIALPEIMTYSATKGALDVFTRHLAKELGPRGITVNSVVPGIVDTDTNASWLHTDPEKRAWASAFSAFDRVGEPAEIADVVAFAASDDARWVTGAVLDATGGSGL